MVVLFSAAFDSGCAALGAAPAPFCRLALAPALENADNGFLAREMTP
jgi:hypothetical protein